MLDAAVEAPAVHRANVDVVIGGHFLGICPKLGRTGHVAKVTKRRTSRNTRVEYVGRVEYVATWRAKTGAPFAPVMPAKKTTFTPPRHQRKPAAPAVEETKADDETTEEDTATAAPEGDGFLKRLDRALGFDE